MRKHRAIPSRKKKRQEAALQLLAPPWRAARRVQHVRARDAHNRDTTNDTSAGEVSEGGLTNRSGSGGAARYADPFSIPNGLPDFRVPLPPSAVCWK